MDKGRIKLQNQSDDLSPCNDRSSRSSNIPYQCHLRNNHLSQSTYPQDACNLFEREQDVIDENIQQIYEEEQSIHEQQHQIKLENELTSSKEQGEKEMQNEHENQDEDEDENYLQNFFQGWISIDIDQQPITRKFAHYYFDLLRNRIQDFRKKIQIMQLQREESQISATSSSLISSVSTLQKVSLQNKQNATRIVKNRRQAYQIDRKYECLIPSCSKRYGDRSSFKVHMKTKHNICKHIVNFDRDDEMNLQYQFQYGHTNCKCVDHVEQMRQQLQRRSQIRLSTISLNNLILK